MNSGDSALYWAFLVPGRLIAMNTTPVLTARGLTRTYGSSFTAVDGINFDIYEGEIFGLLGTNGAGKTSTLEILEGLAKASAGTVKVFGLDPIKDRKKVRPRQGLMMQEGGFPTDLTARETLSMWAGTLSNPLPVGTVLDWVSLDHRANVRVSSLSGGEVRRLDLACAIIGQPQLLFLDEPTTGLDPESRRQAWELIASIQSSGTTIVLTTHYLEEAEYLCDRLAIMHEGKIVTSGTSDSVVAGHPSTIKFDELAIPVEFESRATSHRGTTTITTHQLQKDLAKLLAWAEETGTELSGLKASAASLESVFLDIAEGK